MSDDQRVKDKYIWVEPKRYTMGTYANLIPPDPNARKAVFWVERDKDKLFFVNSSAETLGLVKCGNIGNQSDDDGVYIIEESAKSYIDVLPGEAVYIDEFDGYHDHCVYFTVSIRITSAKLGKVRFKTESKKGGCKRTVLFWDTGEVASHISMSDE